MTGFQRAGILAHPRRPQTAPVARDIAGMLRARGLETWVRDVWTEEDVRAEIAASDLVVAIGGDGAMLHVARVCAEKQVPVLGVNMGNLGFLTEIDDPERCEEPVGQLLAGEYWLEQHMMIRAQVLRAGQVVASRDGLNDVVISRCGDNATVQLEMYIDHDWATTYTADALVIASATGSTAYALAAGGPVLPPELHNILVIPVAAHLSLSRPLVLAQGAIVDVVPVQVARSPAAMNVDGRRVRELEPEERVRVQASAHHSSFVRLRGRNYFYRSLLDRLEPRVVAPHRPALPRRRIPRL